MHLVVCTKEEIRRVEQSHIESFGCELNPVRAQASAEVVRERDRARRTRDLEKFKEKERRYAAANRGRNRERSRLWYEANKGFVTCDCGESVT